MIRNKGIIFPRIVEEVVDYPELQKVWNCSYITAHRILKGITAPNHIRKKALADYLGIPVDELWVRKGDQNGNPTQEETPMTSEDSEIITESTEV